jgi:rhamnogalacturonyl hydrolase YesR
MKIILRFAVLAAVILLVAHIPLRAQPTETVLPKATTPATALSPDITPLAILTTMQRVADWELAHSPTNQTTGWISAAGDAGMMALAGISGDAKYRDAMLAMGESNRWQLGRRLYMADDHCIGQTYAELYFLYRENKMIGPLRERFDEILAKPPKLASLDFSQPGHGQELWSWCDSLFMGPPTWVRLYAATDDERYLNYAMTNFWRTTDYLYDKDEHLFFRDSTYFNKREVNGQKIFWSRGNGWVIAGIVRVLQYLPMNHPDRPRFEQLFKEMADKVLSCQQPDGLWRSSLLDPEDYPAKETSGSGFFTYALAWGVNQGLLDRAKFEPAVRKAWTALVNCVDADGKLTHVQPVGSDPKNFDPDSTAPFGVGAFLLAGSEVYRMEVFWYSILQNTVDLEKADPALAKSPPPFHLEVKITNPSAFRRDCETVEIKLKDLYAHHFSGGELAVMDGASSRILDSQIYNSNPPEEKVMRPPFPKPDKLLFQVDLAPDETRTFYIFDASIYVQRTVKVLPAVPPPIVKTFARYVPEREDDFAWESDRIAHRMYGTALETWQKEPLTSSGVDVWIKRTRNLVINQMYGTMKLFDIHGPSQDDYRVGKTRGCGGLGIWNDGKLYVSKNWHHYRVITTGPIRSEFELTYEAWDAGSGRMVSETKRISIDAGSNMSRVESTFSSDDKSPLQIGVGLAERPGDNVIVPDGSLEINSWRTSTAKGLVVQNQAEGWMAYWQPQDFAKGATAVAIILPKGCVETFTNDNPNLPASAFTPPTHTVGEGQPPLRDLLAVAPAEIGRPFVYYLGAGWDQSGDFPDAKSWMDYVRRFAERRDQPVQVTVGN